jgi:hypothetical protein
MLAPYVQWTIGKFRHEDEIWLYICTGLVVLGVFIEVFEIVHDLREKFGPFKIHRPDKRWVPVVGFIGWLLIVAGVTGEFVFEIKVNTKSEMLEGISDALLKDAQLSALEATTEAGSAEQSARASADALNNVQQRSDIINARLDAASSKLQKLEWRRISPSKFASLGKTLRPFPQSRVLIFVLANEGLEARTFATDLVRFFHDNKVGWQPSLNDKNMIDPLPPDLGLICQIDTDKPAGKALAAVVTKFPGGATVIPTRLRGGVAVIKVGLQPPP